MKKNLYRKQRLSNRNIVLRKYLGLGTQMLVGLGLGIWLGYRVDRWLQTLPLFSCILPLILLIGTFVKLYKETVSGKTKNPTNEQDNP